MTNDKLYLHEVVDARLDQRANYMEHMAKYAPMCRADKGLVNVGIWGTVGSTGRWPEAINLWELDGWAGVANCFRVEFNNPILQDERLAEWYREAVKYRWQGYDRVLIPSPSTPTLEQAIAQRIHGEAYFHEIVQLEPGQARTYVGMLEAEWVPVAEELGFRFLGAYRSALVNDSEVIVISAIETWDHWAEFQRLQDADDPRITRWRRRTQELVRNWENKLMVAGAHVPMRTGVML